MNKPNPRLRFIAVMLLASILAMIAQVRDNTPRRQRTSRRNETQWEGVGFIEQY